MSRQIHEALSGLTRGVNHVLDCPVCGERTASGIMHEDGTTLWQCFRATCRSAGANLVFAPVSGTPPEKPVFAPNPLPGNYNAPWVSPCFALDGTLLGHQTKEVIASRKVVRNWRVVDRPFYDSSVSRQATRVWFVEDATSMRALSACGESSIALLGTGQSARFWDEEFSPWFIRAERPKLIVALDPGAEGEARNLVRFLSEKYGNLACWVPLSKDIKDMSSQELDNLMYLIGG